MVPRDTRINAKKASLFPFLSLFCFTSIFIPLSQLRKTPIPSNSQSVQSFEFTKRDLDRKSKLHFATIQMERGSMIRMRERLDTTTPAKRYLGAGIAFPAINRMSEKSSSGDGSLGSVISLCLTPLGFFRNLETPALCRVCWGFLE